MRFKNLFRWLALGAGALGLALLIFPLHARGVETGPQDAAKAPSSGVIAYYFHGTFRCSTCRKLEALSREAISSGFPKDLASGELAFRVVNVETPKTNHFIQDFQLTTKSLVLVEYRDGKIVRWKNLPKIWQLVRDRDAFIRYVQDETRMFLGESR